jgi:hypothetical protein
MKLSKKNGFIFLYVASLAFAIALVIATTEDAKLHETREFPASGVAAPATIRTESTLALMKMAGEAVGRLAEDMSTAAGMRRAGRQLRSARGSLEFVIELHYVMADASGTAKADFAPANPDPRLAPLLEAAKSDPLQGSLAVAALYAVLTSECGTDTEASTCHAIGYMIQLCLWAEAALDALGDVIRGKEAIESALTGIEGAMKEDHKTYYGRRRAARQLVGARESLEALVKSDHARSDASRTARNSFTPSQRDQRLPPLLQAAEWDFNPPNDAASLADAYNDIAHERDTSTYAGVCYAIGDTIQMCLWTEVALEQYGEVIRVQQASNGTDK